MRDSQLAFLHIEKGNYFYSLALWVGDLRGVLVLVLHYCERNKYRILPGLCSTQS